MEEQRTWRDTLAFIKEHKLDQDEYFEIDTNNLLNSPVWGEGVAKIAVWLAVGSNEGYYVHIEAIYRRGDGEREGRRLKMGVGKFWSIEAGMRAVDLLTRFLYNFPLPLEDSIRQVDLVKVEAILEEKARLARASREALRGESYWKGYWTGKLNGMAEAKEAIDPTYFPLAPKLIRREVD